MCLCICKVFEFIKQPSTLTRLLAMVEKDLTKGMEKHSDPARNVFHHWNKADIIQHVYKYDTGGGKYLSRCLKNTEEIRDKVIHLITRVFRFLMLLNTFHGICLLTCGVGHTCRGSCS